MSTAVRLPSHSDTFTASHMCIDLSDLLHFLIIFGGNFDDLKIADRLVSRNMLQGTSMLDFVLGL